MRKLVVLVIGLMVSVSAFAKPSDDKFEEIGNNLINRFGEIVEQCCNNDDGSNEHKFDQMMAASSIFDLVREQIETAIYNGASYKAMMLDNYVYIEAEGESIGYEIDGDVAIVTVGYDDGSLYETTFNANGEFFDTRIR